VGGGWWVRMRVGGDADLASNGSVLVVVVLVDVIVYNESVVLVLLLLLLLLLAAPLLLVRLRVVLRTCAEALEVRSS
jgi:hypothetical protein